MKAVAVKELKNRLSHYLREIAAGEVVLVTDRGKVVAELRRPSTDRAPDAWERTLEPLAADGLLLIGLPQDRRAYRKSRVRVGRSTQDVLDAERGER
jgi:antitoxin (DNA-binding transcriptional repressor) of toxin-antitoxin stability system